MAQASDSGGSKKSRWEKLKEYGAQGVDYLGRPAEALRAGIGAFQDDAPVLPAMKEQIVNSEAPEAPSGYDIAQKFGEQHDVQNPYALTALSALAEMADPLSAIPGGAVAKVGRKAAGMAKSGARAMKTAKEADVAKDLLTRADDFGKVIVKDTPSSQGLGKVIMKDEEIARKNAAMLEKNPELKKLLEDPKHANDPRFSTIRRKLGRENLGKVKRTGERQVREGLRYGTGDREE